MKFFEVLQAAGDQDSGQLCGQILFEHGFELLGHEATGALHGLRKMFPE